MTTITKPRATAIAVDYRFERFGRRHIWNDLGFRGGPRPGEPMPEFDLPTTDGGRLRTSDLVGRRPLVLATGSFTCPMTATAAPVLKDLYAEFGERFAFALLYVRELHPGQRYPQPDTFERKLSHARDHRERDAVPFPVAVDDVDGTLHRALDAKANAIYVMGLDGNVAYRALWAGDRIGPLRRALEDTLDGRTSGQRVSHTVAVLRGMGRTHEILDLAGAGAGRDVLIAAPPMYMVARLARVFGPLSPLARGVAAAATLSFGMAGIIALLLLR